MAEYAQPKRGVELIFYIGLVQQSNTKLLKTDPTIAAGDFKVIKDGGASANLATLPSVSPAGSAAVKITLSATEMAADNVTVQCIDAAGAEWCNQIINIRTATRALEDLAFPTTSGRSLDVSATGEAGVDWANVGSPTTAVNLTGTNIKTDQKVDVETIKTQAVTCAAGVTVRAHVGHAAAPGANTGAPTVDASNRIAGIAGTINTFDGLNNVSTAQVNTEADTALTDYGALKPATAGRTLVVDAAGLADANMVKAGPTGSGTAQTAGDIAALINALQLYTTHVVARCTVGAASSTTSVVSSACSPAGAVADQFKGRVMIFDNDTTTAALRGQATDITASSAAATPTFTVTALTTAPASGDLFTIV